MPGWRRGPDTGLSALDSRAKGRILLKSSLSFQSLITMRLLLLR